MSNSEDEHATSLWRSCVGSLMRKQVASETVHGARLAVVELHGGCDSCAEENKACKCETDNGEVGFDSANHHAKANSSFAHSVINMVGMLIGLGQLSTPYALENGGWSSVFLLVGLGIICAYTSHIIGKCLEEDPDSKTYQDVGQQAFGAGGRVLASAFIYLEIFFALVSYTISLHDNLALALPGARLGLPPSVPLSSPQLLTAAAVALALPSLWLRDLSSISFLSFGGILMSLLIFSTIASTAAFGGLGAHQGIPVLQLRKVPGISGLYIFSFAGHIVFPNIYRAMKDPSQFTKVSVTSFSLVTILYTSLAFMGAKLFGPSVSSQITLSMPRHRVATKVALWAVVLTPMTKYALEFAPFAAQLERGLPPSVGSRGRTATRGAVGSLLLVLILALALSVPYFEHVLGLTGSLVSSGISVVIPCVFYLRIRWPRVSKRGVLLNGAIIVVGVGFGVAGTMSSFKSLVETMRRSH